MWAIDLAVVQVTYAPNDPALSRQQCAVQPDHEVCDVAAHALVDAFVRGGVVEEDAIPATPPHRPRTCTSVRDSELSDAGLGTAG